MLWKELPCALYPISFHWRSRDLSQYGEHARMWYHHPIAKCIIISPKHSRALAGRIRWRGTRQPSVCTFLRCCRADAKNYLPMIVSDACGPVEWCRCDRIADTRQTRVRARRWLNYIVHACRTVLWSLIKISILAAYFCCCWLGPVIFLLKPTANYAVHSRTCEKNISLAHFR